MIFDVVIRHQNYDIQTDYLIQFKSKYKYMHKNRIILNQNFIVFIVKVCWVNNR